MGDQHGIRLRGAGAANHPFAAVFAVFAEELRFHVCAHACLGFSQSQKPKKPTALTSRYATQHWEGFPTRWPFFRLALSQWVAMAEQPAALDTSVALLVGLLADGSIGSPKPRPNSADVRSVSLMWRGEARQLSQMAIYVVALALLERILWCHGFPGEAHTRDVLEGACVRLRRWLEAAGTAARKEPLPPPHGAIWTELQLMAVEHLAAVRGCMSASAGLVQFLGELQSATFVANGPSSASGARQRAGTAAPPPAPPGRRAAMPQRGRLASRRTIPSAARPAPGPVGGDFDRLACNKHARFLRYGLEARGAQQGSAEAAQQLAGYLEFLLGNVQKERDRATQLAQLGILQAR